MCFDAEGAAQWPQPAIYPSAGSQPGYVSMFAVDIVSFSVRDPDIQVHVRHALYRIVEDACRAGRVPLNACRVEDRGDGIFVVIPAYISVALWLAPLVLQLRSGIRAHNRTANEAARIRLRLAVHAGYVTMEPQGVSGPAAIELFRMLDASAFKAELAGNGGDLALIVSASLYDNVVKFGPGAIEPEAFRPLADKVKETEISGWVWLPQRAPAPTSINDLWCRSAPRRETSGPRGAGGRTFLPPARLLRHRPHG